MVNKIFFKLTEETVGVQNFVPLLEFLCGEKCMQNLRQTNQLVRFNNVNNDIINNDGIN